MEAEKPYDEDDELIAFGPHFGGEAASEFERRLKTLGLDEYRDFFIYEDACPHWVTATIGLDANALASNVRLSGL